jgi:hypothetical protein
MSFSFINGQAGPCYSEAGQSCTAEEFLAKSKRQFSISDGWRNHFSSLRINGGFKVKAKKHREESSRGASAKVTLQQRL